jgi:hypothetical protein
MTACASTAAHKVPFGVLGGAMDDGIFPVTMEIEHVRVWQPPA